MINRILTTVVFVRDLAVCTEFYRNTFRLSYQGGDVHSADFLLPEGVHLILLDPSGAEDLVGTQGQMLASEGGPRGLLAASVADVDVAYKASSASFSHFSEHSFALFFCLAAQYLALTPENAANTRISAFLRYTFSGRL